MKNKKLFLFVLVGLLSVTFAIPAAANGRPTWAMDPDDVPGWWLFKEDSIEGWNFTYGMYNIEFSAWYQIWINNATSHGSDAIAAWAEADSAMLLLIMDLGIDMGNFMGTSLNLWPYFVEFFAGLGYETKEVPGFDMVVMWSEGAVWWALGGSESFLVFALGYGEQVPPGNPFEGAFWAMKDPSSAGATETDVEGLITAQGSMFGGAIPGFNFIPIVISIVILTSIIVLLRKDQLSLLKTF